MESALSVLARAYSLARAVAEADFLSSLQLVRVAEVVARAAERCGFPNRSKELQDAADLLSCADLQKMANAAAMVSSAAARAGQAAENKGLDQFEETCQYLEVAARELSIAVAAETAVAGSKLRDRSAESCNWMCWRKKGRGNAEARTDEFDDRGLGQVLLHHKAWPMSNSTSTSTSTASGVLDGTPGGLQDGRLLPEENSGDSLGYALFGSLTFLPYLGPEGLVMKTVSSNGKFIFHLVFSSLWSAVSLGVPCRHCRHSAIMLQCADIAGRIGMVGITALVIWYSHRLIAPDAVASSFFILGVACFLHIFAWIWDRWQMGA